GGLVLGLLRADSKPMKTFVREGAMWLFCQDNQLVLYIYLLAKLPALWLGTDVSARLALVFY
uniref:Uncharacterized protein n=1 Tax=Oryza brachyantha TaxID=4533 RepID=J3MWN1_ORYBR